MVRKLLASILLLLLLLYVGLGWFLSHDKVLSERHQEFKELSFDYKSNTFSDFLEYSRQRLLSARVDEPSEAVIRNLLPFELLPAENCPVSDSGKAQKGILLIHGLIASPYSMRDFGEFLQSQCFYVLGLLLPDHGSRPGDLISSQWEQWAEAVSFATKELSHKADTIFLSGHSAGGTLAILEAANNTEVDGLLLFAPALSITPAAKYARFITPLGYLFAGAHWYEVEADEAVYRYESVPFSAAAETYALIKAMDAAENLRLRNLPILTVASVEDNTVGTDTILAFMQRNNNADSLTLLYSQFSYPSGDKLKVLPSSAPEQGILSLSHLGLMTPPTHQHYGQDGAYRNCGHYGSIDNPAFIQCKNGERSFYGETTANNLEQGNIERIAFNPYYDAMLGEVLQFLKKLED